MSISPDLLEDYCNSLTGWTESESDGGVVEVSPAGQFHFTANGTLSSRADIVRDVLSGVANFTIEIILKLDTVGVDENHGFLLRAINDTMELLVEMHNSKIKVYDGATFNEVGSNLAPTGSFITWRFEVTGGVAATATVDVYKNGVLVGDNVDCSYASGASGSGPFIQMLGYASTATESHLDRILIGTGLGDFSGISPSASVSPSVSPSASVSPSVSPSASKSPSASVSPSVSPSASKSPSASVSPSVSPSISPSASKSPSASASGSPSLGYSIYSRGDSPTLPTNDNDLEILYTEQEEEDVAEADGVMVGQAGSVQYMIHQFKKFVGDDPYFIVDYQGQTSLAPSSSTVYFQIYNRVSGLWETIDSNDLAGADLPIELSSRIGSPSNYRDADDVVSCRVYQLAL